MHKLEQIVNFLAEYPSDVNEHAKTLIKYGSECEHITECGVRWITTSWFFLGCVPKKLISIDMHNPKNWLKGGKGENQQIIQRGFNTIEEVEEIAKEIGVDYKFIQANVLDIEIEQTDLLFLDTFHAYRQLSKELAKFHSKVNKYIILHDTETYKLTDETNYEELGEEWKAQGIGLQKAIDEFLEQHSEWKIKEVLKNNNGLTILERVK